MSHQPDEFDLPSRIADSLRVAYTHHGVIPSRIDDSILAAARSRFEVRRRKRMTIRWGASLAAGLAAVIALAVILRHPAAPTKSLAKGDLNADGRVNMIDALLLARHVAGNDKPNPSWDTNGDGRVDQTDIDALAAASVNLSQSGLAQRTLPKLQDLGLDRLPVGSALADVSHPPTFAKANATEDPQEAHP